MTLTDAGPLIAIIDRDDADHGLCVAALSAVRLPLQTTWPAFTEAMYVLGASTGAPGQRALWGMVSDGVLEIVDLPRSAIDRAARLMEKYADLPMDLADATLVAVADQLGRSRIFTIDSDFTVYRRANRRPFTLIP